MALVNRVAPNTYKWRCLGDRSDSIELYRVICSAEIGANQIHYDSCDFVLSMLQACAGSRPQRGVCTAAWS